MAVQGRPPIIRSGYDRRLRDRLLHSAPATGAATASSSQGPVLLHDLAMAALDTTNTWQTNVGATGVASIVSGWHRLNCVAASDTSNMSSLKSVRSPYGTQDGVSRAKGIIWKRLNFECVLKALTNLTNQDNARFFVGLSGTQNGIRTTGNIVGFVLASDALNTIRDEAGAEVVTVVSPAPDMTRGHKLRMEFEFVDETGGTFALRYYVDQALIYTETTTAPAGPFYVSLSAGAEAGGSSIVDVGDPHCWLEAE